MLHALTSIHCAQMHEYDQTGEDAGLVFPTSSALENDNLDEAIRDGIAGVHDDGL